MKELELSKKQKEWLNFLLDCENEGGYKGFIDSKSISLETKLRVAKFKIDTLSETIERLKGKI